MACELEVADRITFAGKMSHVENALSVADLFLLASETESFGLAALEAMACEVPVIGTNIGGIPEVVEDGVSGLLVPLDDPDAMAAAARELLTDDERLAAFRAAARLRAVTHFREEAGISAYERYYETICAGRRVESLPLTRKRDQNMVLFYSASAEG